MNKEIISRLESTKTVDELKELASKNNYPLSDEEANHYFKLFHTEGKIADDELNNVTGGAICRNGRYYIEAPNKWYDKCLIVTAGNSCQNFQDDGKSWFGAPGTCPRCYYSSQPDFKSAVLVCWDRTLDNDPCNDHQSATIHGDVG